MQCKYSGCRVEALPDHRFCHRHNEQHLENGRRRRALLRSEGRCPLCGGKPAPRRIHCLYCLGKANEANAIAYPKRAEQARADAKEQRARHIAAGRCRCGKQRKPGCTSCAACLSRRVKGINRSRQERFVADLCILCGKHPAMPNRKIGACCRKLVAERKPRSYVPMSRNHPWYQSFEAAMNKVRWKRQQAEQKGAS